MCKRVQRKPPVIPFSAAKGTQTTAARLSRAVKSLAITSFAGAGGSVQPVTLKGEKKGSNGTDGKANGRLASGALANRLVTHKPHF